MIRTVLLPLLALGIGAAQAAPGEDPVVLSKPVDHLQLPMAQPGPSQGLDGVNGLPANVQAKIARLEAKALSDSTSGIYTDADIKTTVTGNQQNKTCIQDVGSNSSLNSPVRYGPGNQQQIVVLRGDLVNICK
ncbi:MAG: hypothetical protein ACN6O3_11725 [Comamonas sp.]